MMGTEDLKKMYHTLHKDRFPSKMEISFYDDENCRQSMLYEKVEWTIESEKKGLRYGENPCQEASFYKLVNGNIRIGDVSTILPGKYLASDIQLLQSGKHPGKTNITDVDNALNILRYFNNSPCCVIVKHNNPCGAAIGESNAEAFSKALMADRIAAFGGAVVINRPLDMETALLLSENYIEVVAAPGYEENVVDLLKKKKNIRVMEIKNIEKLHNFIGERVIDFKSLIDGSVITQLSYLPVTRKKEDFLPASCTYKNREYKIARLPTEAEYEDLLFGWLVESGITSNSVIYVKDRVTVGIGTGEQDRVGVAEIARDKAYRKTWDRLSWVKYSIPWSQLEEREKREEIIAEAASENGGLKGSVMVSDAFFPFRDGVDVGLDEGITAVVQPGGSLRDF
jgi:phosphoribosylaminoimidazolecarboxamide formyltransferase/IMP cyclohydrolase